MSVLSRTIVQKYVSYSARDEAHDRKTGARDARKAGSAASYQLLELGEKALETAGTADVERYQAEHNKQAGLVKAELDELKQRSDDFFQQRVILSEYCCHLLGACIHVRCHFNVFRSLPGRQHASI